MLHLKNTHLICLNNGMWMGLSEKGMRWDVREGHEKMPFLFCLVLVLLV